MRPRSDVRVFGCWGRSPHVRALTVLSVGLCVGLSSLIGAQTKRELKDAAKKAINAFFKRPTSQPALSGTLLATLEDTRISESSGLAASRRNRDVLWTHNDSGDGPYLFAIDRKGRTLARFTVPNAKNVDWEDIAIGPGADGKPALYVGDIGDNNHHRTDNVVYRVPEPLVDTAKTLREEQTAPPEKFPYRYPDGSHDCETLMVHPKTGEIFLVTKEGSGVSGVYTFPKPLRTGQVTTLQKVGTLRFSNQFLSGNGKYAQGERMATGGDLSPDGQRLIIRTYIQGYEWRLKPGQSVPDALRGKPRAFVLPLTKQGEAICYRADGKTVLTTSEGIHTPLYEIPLPN